MFSIDDDWFRVDLGFRNHDELVKWLKSHCEGNYQIGIWHIEFEKESDMLMYKLACPEEVTNL